jgi:hypothetical protein
MKEIPENREESHGLLLVFNIKKHYNRYDN